MDQIASEAGITKPILYRHFGDKGGLYRALVERYVAKVLEELRAAMESETHPRKRLAATIDTYLGFIERERDLYEYLAHRAAGERPEAQAAIADFAREVARAVSVNLGEQLRAAGADSGPAEVWAHGIVGMVQLAGDWWIGTRSMPRERVVEYLTGLLWRGFSTYETPTPPQSSLS
jgi:AcrR family transcriptional regulator